MLFQCELVINIEIVFQWDLIINICVVSVGHDYQYLCFSES